MASTYSNLKFQLMATGENTTTWGTVTNVNLGTAIEEAITGSVDVAFSSAHVTLTLTDTNSTQSARNLRLNLTGTATAGYNLVLGSGCQIEKAYIINNGTDGVITVKNTTGTGIAVPVGKTMWVYNDGTNVVDAVNAATTLTVSGATSLASTLGVTGATTLSSTLAATGAATLSSTLTVANLTTINSGSSTLGLVVTTQTSGAYCIQTNPISQSGTYYAIQFRSAATQVGGINSDASTTTYNTSSDERLKDFIGAYSADDALSVIKQDPTREFTWKATGEKAVGWGAQTSHAVSADLASPGFGEPGDENWSPWGIDHGKRTPYLWAAIGGTNGILDQLVALQARVAALEAALEAG